MNIIKLFLEWLPRLSALVLSLSFWILAGIGAHGREGLGWEPILLTIPFIIAWRFKRTGGSLYVALGLLLWFLPNARDNLDILPLITIPFLVVGLLFWADALSRPSKSNINISSEQA